MGVIERNLASVRETIRERACISGRDPAAVTIIAISKGHGAEAVNEAARAGLTEFGENRVQEIIPKSQAVGVNVDWHFIGRLQTNKVRRLLTSLPVKLIHSIDRTSIAVAVSEESRRLGRVQNVLVQVNVSGESSKAGVSPAELPGFLFWAAGLDGIRIKGLMTMAPISDDAEKVRPYFRKLKEIAEKSRKMAIPGIELDHLSMGMTDDYAVAIEEGATMVRVGRAIFGQQEPEPDGGV